MISDIFKKLLKKLNQTFCLHRYAYIKSELLIGRRYSLHRCGKCNHMVGYAYKSIISRDQYFTDFVDGAGRSLKSSQ